MRVNSENLPERAVTTHDRWLREKFYALVDSVTALRTTEHEALVSTHVGALVADTHSRQVAQLGRQLHADLVRIDSSLTEINESIRELGAGLHADLDEVKQIAFAQWRDGVGRDYYYGYRERALTYIRQYRDISEHYAGLISAQMAEVVATYPQWKELSWRSDGLTTGIFVTQPEWVDPPNLLDISPEPPVPADQPEFPSLTAEEARRSETMGMIIGVLAAVAFVVLFARFLPLWAGAVGTLVALLIGGGVGTTAIERGKQKQFRGELVEWKAQVEATDAQWWDDYAYNNQVMNTYIDQVEPVFSEYKRLNAEAREKVLAHIARDVGADVQATSFTEWAPYEVTRAVDKLTALIEGEVAHPPAQTEWFTPPPLRIHPGRIPAQYVEPLTAYVEGLPDAFAD